jgi:trehalose-phosphatase
MPERNGVPAVLWREVSLAEHRLLMLDYDGTLAPFHRLPDEALPWPRSLELLRAIAARAHTDVGMLSGRPVDELLRLLGPLDAELVGEHGWERRERGGGIVREPLPRALRLSLDAAEAGARAQGWAGQLERKRTGLVLHVRGLPPSHALDLVARCEAAWSEAASHPGLRLDRIDGGLELRARGQDKGTAVLRLLSRRPPGTLGVFLGDDVSDEDAFAALRGRGFGVRVGGRSRESHARGWLDSYREVPGFLETWLARAGDA